jgi:hypothetical protein
MWRWVILCTLPHTAATRAARAAIECAWCSLLCVVGRGVTGTACGCVWRRQVYMYANGSDPGIAIPRAAFGGPKGGG